MHTLNLCKSCVRCVHDRRALFFFPSAPQPCILSWFIVFISCAYWNAIKLFRGKFVGKFITSLCDISFSFFGSHWQHENVMLYDASAFDFAFAFYTFRRLVKWPFDVNLHAKHRYSKVSIEKYVFNVCNRNSNHKFIHSFARKNFPLNFCIWRKYANFEHCLNTAKHKKPQPNKSAWF